MLLFPKATFPGLSCALSPFLSFSLLFSSPLSLLLLFWETICARCLEVLFVGTWWRREEDIKWKTLITRLSYREIWAKREEASERGVKKGINQTEWNSSTPSKNHITNSSLVSSQFNENNIAVAWRVVNKSHAEVIDEDRGNTSHAPRAYLLHVFRAQSPSLVTARYQTSVRAQRYSVRTHGFWQMSLEMYLCLC